MKIRNRYQQVIDLAKAKGVLQGGDLAEMGISREYLPRMAALGKLLMIRRGLYALPGGEASANRSLVEVTAASPRSIVCLLSALRFHGLTTQLPHEVWIALPAQAWNPRTMPFAVQVVRMSGESFSTGIETHILEGIPVRIYSAVKTVADCFKFRGRIGLDVAVEALHDFLHLNRGGVNDLWHHAVICRVSRVIQPYLDSAR